MAAYCGNAGACLDGEFDSTPSPNNQHLLPSGIDVLGIELWIQKLADVA